MLVFYSEVIKKAKKSIQAVTLLEYLPPKLFSVTDFKSNGICWLLVPLLYYKQLYKLAKLQFHLLADSFVALPELIYHHG